MAVTTVPAARPTNPLSSTTLAPDRASIVRIARAVLTPALIVLLPLCVFLAFFHPEILRIGNFGWLLDGTDNGENALGAHAYWHDAGAGASLKTMLLNAPEGTPVLYTDSNPLLTLIAKPFAALMPMGAQLVGPFILFNLVMQTFFAWLLLRRRAPGTLALWAGVAFLAFPPTLLHRYLHVNLMAHWTILAALCLFLDRKRSRKPVWWAGLIAMTAMIHSYLLFLVAAIWASSLLARFVAGDRREKLATVVQFGAIIAMVGILARWLGVGDQMTTATYGAFRMPIDALWNPGVKSYNALLPSSEYGAAHWFEGFQYLGLGGLLLIALAFVVAKTRTPGDGEVADNKRLRDLAPALLTLAILAVAQLSLPPIAMALLDPIRASGRLFWPVGYVMMLVALLAIYRLPARQAGLALLALIAVQAVDLRGMADAVRDRSARIAGSQPFDRTPDPRWDDVIADAQSVAFMGADVTDELGLFQEIAWRAVDAGIPVSNVYAARISRASMKRSRDEDAAFARGALVPGRLYVMLVDKPVPQAVDVPTMTIDGTTVVLPRGRD